jgi:hypothetical protein
MKAFLNHRGAATGFVVSHVSGVGALSRTALTCLTTNERELERRP